MIKIIVFSVGFILVVLAVNSLWPLNGLRVNPPKGRELLQSFQEAPRNLPQKMEDGVKGVVKGIEKNITSYFLKKTGGEIVGLLENLPPEQQEEIKKEYCK